MKNKQLSFLDDVLPSISKDKPVNVATVPQRSPFRYPGGKTWLIPTVRDWLKQDHKKSNLLIEPFAGGGIVSLTAAFEDLAEKIIMSEIDPEVAAVWEVILNGGNNRLADRIYHFDKIQGRFMLTYDDTDEIRTLANKYSLKFKTIPMKTTHHLQKNEIIISDNLDW